MSHPIICVGTRGNHPEPTTFVEKYGTTEQTYHSDFTHILQRLIFYIVLWTGSDLCEWENIFIGAGIFVASSKLSAETFASKKLTKDSLPMLHYLILKELCIKTMGETLAIVKLVKESPASPPSQANYIKTQTAKLPQIHSEMTAQFQRFKIDWDIFTQITNLHPLPQSNIQQYNYTDKTVQNSIINNKPDFSNTNSSKILDMLKVLIMQKLNPMVHRILFPSILQSENESIQKYLIHLNSGTWESNFVCPICDHDSHRVYIKAQGASGSLMVSKLD